MKKTLLISLFFVLLFGSTTQAQDPLKLQYYKRMAILNGYNELHFRETFINENGWLFIKLSSYFDSLEIDDYNLYQLGKDDSTRTIMMAFDNSGKLRWTFEYNKRNTTLGGMVLLASGPNNSLYAICGARDSLVLNNGIRLDFDEPGEYNAIMVRFDSTGQVVDFINASKEHSITSYFSFERFYNYGMLIASSLLKSYVIDSTLKEVIAYPLISARATTIDKDLNAYYSFLVTQKSTRNLMDTTIYTDSGEFKVVLMKVSKEGNEFKRKWTHVIITNTFDELQDNKLIKVDRHGNVFWAIQHKIPIEIQGTVIPYYENVPYYTNTKACILRFDTDGQFLDAYYDSTSTAPSLSSRQTIWLEYDKDMNVYAYLYSSSRVYNFDKVNFPETYSHLHKILIFDNNTKSFNKAYTHIGGRFGKSMLPHRFVFWHPIKTSNYTFLEDIFVYAKWNSDHVFAVMDTMTPKYPITVNQINTEVNDITIYPNPSSNSFIINNSNQQPVTCSVYSMDMRLIDKITLEGDATIELSSVISPGVYFVQCQNSEGFSQTIKIIKQ
ncbi:MAG: T9SS type A sorting domain-containing protein [Bacteroidia bacterium]|nr:T9SS type A sorting domain-containing protein [Bacteroidia bacterium]